MSGLSLTPDAPPDPLDAILAAQHFCNLHRRDDRTSIWVRVNIVEPRRDDPDLFLKIAVARFTNEIAALAEIDWLRPFDLVTLHDGLKARQARGETIFRTQAYKYPMPPELKGMGALQCLFEVVLAPMARDRERLRPRIGDTLQAFSDRLRECHGVGAFLAGQVIADLKQVEPLLSASDRETFVAPGPGSERGLNRLFGLKLNHQWSEPLFCAAIAHIRPLINAKLIDHGIEPLDGQDANNWLCECDKALRAIERGGKPSRKYKPRREPAPGAAPRPEIGAQEPAGVERRDRRDSEPEAITGAEQPSGGLAEPIIAEPSLAETVSATKPSESIAVIAAPLSEPKPEQKPAEPDLAKIPDFILADMGRTPKEEPKPEARAPHPPPPNHYQGGQQARGRLVAEYLYRDAAGHPYILVRKYVDAAGEKSFPTYRPENGRWIKGVKGTPFTRKIPYRLPELIAALAANPDERVFVCEGEKDADAAARLGLVASANPGGAVKRAWTPELTGWFKALDVRRAAILEDNDDTGRAHVAEVANALSGTVADLRAVTFRELPAHGDLSDWIARGHGKDDLAARTEAASPWRSCELMSVRASTIEMKGLAWLWPGRFARGKIGIIAGLPDEGKGLLLAQMAARCTNPALAWPNSEGRAPQGNVIVLTAEDDIEDTVAPRLVAAAADLDRIEIVQLVREHDSKTGERHERTFSLVRDLAKLRAKITEIGNVTMIIIDPISAYLGIGEVDSFRDTATST